VAVLALFGAPLGIMFTQLADGNPIHHRPALRYPSATTEGQIHCQQEQSESTSWL